jgi:hypothetical protein
MSEADLDDGVRRILKDLPVLLAYHTFDSRRAAAGFPDWVFTGPGGVMFRELKRENGQPTGPQKQWLAALSYAGADAGIWRPADLTGGKIARELLELTRDRWQDGGA